MEFTNNCDIINQMIIIKEFDELEQEPSLVYTAIYPMVQKYLARLGVNDLQHLGSYELTVGANKFDMKVLALTAKSTKTYSSLFNNILKISQFTYFWDIRITLFREVDRYYELEEFIAINKLKKHVISVEEFAGVNSLGQNIKLVTFDSTSDEIERDELLVNYEEFLRNKLLSEPDYAQTGHYYFTKSLPWHSSDMFSMYSSPFLNHDIFLELQTFLTCMRELTYAREPHLDLISLCSLKLAFCDELDLTEASRDLQFEIDALIERFLRRMVQKQTYIQNGKFDLHRYTVDTNFPTYSHGSYSAILNLIYTFQHIFHCTNLQLTTLDGCGTFIDHLEPTIMLIDESKVLNTLRDKPNIIYKVDCQNYNKMNSKLFCELLECENVKEIELDTNYQWTNEPYLTDLDYLDEIKILLVGTNEFNFIEDFIQFLKTLPTSSTSAIVLEILGVTLKSYNIFKNLELMQLEFDGLEITFIMLTELLECDLMDFKISFNNCTIEDKTCTWSLLINEFDRANVTVEILEEEKTWQYLFESIANHLTKFELNEFNFTCDLMIIWHKCFNSALVRSITFRFDEFKTRLELQNRRGQAIDLYDWKNTVHESDNDSEDESEVESEDESEDKSEDDYKNFEFYQ